MKRLSEVIETCYVPILERVSSVSMRHLESVKYDRNNAQHLYLACVYCSIVELSQTIFNLFKSDSAIGIPILLRSLLEAYADLINLIEDPNYPKAMVKKLVLERKRLLSQARKLKADPAFEAFLKRTENMTADNELEKLSQEIKEVSPADRFKRAGLTEVKASVYWALCLHSHNNVGVFQQRHVRDLDEGIQVALFKKAGDADLYQWLDTLAAIWIESNERFHKFFSTGHNENYRGLLNSLLACRRTANQAMQSTGEAGG